jgi:hypothetical protein
MRWAANQQCFVIENLQANRKWLAFRARVRHLDAEENWIPGRPEFTIGL